jgi:hypothetical protein
MRARPITVRPCCKAWEIENAPEPFEAEVTAAEQLISYLAKWDPLATKAGQSLLLCR